MVVQLPLLMTWPNSTPSLGLDKLVLGLVRNMGMTSAIYQESSINLNGESMMGLSLSHNATGMRRWTKDTQTQMPQHIIMFIVLTIVRTIVMDYWSHHYWSHYYCYLSLFMFDWHPIKQEYSKSSLGGYSNWLNESTVSCRLQGEVSPSCSASVHLFGHLAQVVSTWTTLQDGKQTLVWPFRSFFRKWWGWWWWWWWWWWWINDYISGHDNGDALEDEEAIKLVK